MSSPACTELEVQVMNWFGKLLNLPKEFLNESEGPGGGVIQVFTWFMRFIVLVNIFIKNFQILIAWLDQILSMALVKGAKKCLNN